MPESRPHDASTSDVDAVFDEAERALRDSAYVAVGLAVLAFQRAQVRRRELAKRLARPDVSEQFEDIGRSVGANVDSARAQLAELAKSLDHWAAPARRQIDQQIDTVADLLPAGARDMVQAVRSAVAVPEARLRAAVGLS